MSGVPESVADSGAFQPSEQDVASVHAWFAEYDAHAAAGDVEKMADMAMYPLNVVSDSPEGNGAAAQWARAGFVESMKHVVGGAGEVKMESVRKPIFLTGKLVVVITEATFTTAEGAQDVRYADVLVKVDDRWLFQTMIQGGWGENL
ncbi:nuclear transport factor 2 family protein [Allokutzneria sp. A3M-2-11 16]|uniref:nuclear transport factor 2 family protein n=1 Tax=Allokutzneria sp. A3M-2-11 16 TaxID=2962043 RepID=UPI0020B6C41B|nr:nuclear transport factor 2 family protein [Allokutzneria sp. A3M-2-11 16]MCP3805271.1 nuclear transport factor 2 family protein [Allokutzneria sp. A3M-2-11 16]